MSPVFALVLRDDGLEFRSEEPSRVWRHVAPDARSYASFAVQHAAPGRTGLLGFAGRLSAPEVGPYPVNRIAGPLVAALGGPDGDWFGDVAICGSQATDAAADPQPCGLSEPQQRLILDAYDAVRADLPGAEPPEA